MGAGQARRERLAALLPADVDAMLVTNLVNVRYLTGFTGSNGAVLVGCDGAAAFATDGRYLVQAADEVPDIEVVEARAVALGLVERAGALGVRRLGIEPADVTLDLHRALLDQIAGLDGAGGSLELVVVGPLVEGLRAIKDPVELQSLEKACAITGAAFSDVVDRLRPGVSERDVEWWLREAMRDHGADGLAFDSIVAFGPNSAVPHHEPSDRLLARGDLVKLDFGARYRGYHADMTRTVVIGPPADWQVDLHATVLGVQQRCLAAAVVGSSPPELNEMARTGIEAAGHAFVHGLGHGVGLEIHERPMLSPRSDTDELVEGVVVTVEPGIYLPGRGGVRIEDTVSVEVGGPRPLTPSPRELIAVG
jgi:Xaa-Pro aminopeptidase